MNADVIIAGAGPTGLMLAAELRLAGVRPLVLERRAELRETPRANGLGGQILQLLYYRGLLARFEDAAGASHPAPIYPFGDVHVDFSSLAEPPLRGLSLPQPRLERMLAEHAGALGADIRRGHGIVGVSQDDSTVTATVQGPDGTYEVTARYLVGCDGAHSKVRDAVGIPFPGTTYPEVNRLAQVTLADGVTRLDNGDVEVPGQGTIPAGFTRTDGGLFGFGWISDEIVLVLTTEAEAGEVDDDMAMTMSEFQDSMQRVIGASLPVGKVIRLSRYQFQARQAERYRVGRVMIAGDAAHQFPATGVGLNAGMLDAVNLAWKLAADIQGWAPPGLLDTFHVERHLAGARTMLHTQAQVALRRGHDAAAEALRTVFLELVTDEQPLQRLGSLIAGTDVRYPVPGATHTMTGTFVPDLTLHTDDGTTTVADLMHKAHPIFLDLADRKDLREIVQRWHHRIDIHTAKTDDRPAEALLIRPDAHIAWAATDPLALADVLTNWFGEPA